MRGRGGDHEWSNDFMWTKNGGRELPSGRACGDGGINNVDVAIILRLDIWTKGLVPHRSRIRKGMHECLSPGEQHPTVRKRP